jgi:hypothetical protein
LVVLLLLWLLLLLQLFPLGSGEMNFQFQNNRLVFVIRPFLVWSLHHQVHGGWTSIIGMFPPTGMSMSHKSLPLVTEKR